MFNLKQDCKYALLAPTSMGIRLSPFHGAPVRTSDIFYMQTTSAESNVATVLSSLGMPVKLLTAFIKDSPVSAKIKDSLKSRRIEYEGVEFEQGSPWGCRHQINIADSGFGVRAPQVYNDRAGEVGRLLKAEHFDLEHIFCGEGEGVSILHISGLIAALSAETGKFCLALAEKAKAAGTVVSFDLNYRASFWENRKKELSRTFARIASVSDILLGNEEDFQLALNIKGSESAISNLSALSTVRFMEILGEAKKAFPNVSVFATTLRGVISVNSHLWGAILSADGNNHTIEPRQINVLDRIGGGDAFVGGLLYSMLKRRSLEECLQFGWACGGFAVTVMEDYIQPLNEEQIWDIWNGNTRVKR